VKVGSIVSSSGLVGRGFEAGERDKLPLKVLLHSRTVVEKQSFVTTGVLTSVEGDLFEIELNEFSLFDLGETVKLTIYSPVGIQTIQSIIFAKYDGAIAVIQPPVLQQKFMEKREHPRVDAEGTVRVLGLIEASGGFRELAEPVEAQIRDISVSGVSFLATDASVFQRDRKLRAILEIGFEIACDIEIVRREQGTGGWICGAKMTLPDADALRPIRAYVLRQQVEKNTRLRKAMRNQQE
jgi:hypothetical protein